MDTSPRVQRYLDGLPHGLDSYPTCVQKASVFREFIKLASGADLRVLPDPLGELVRAPPPVTDWIPEVHATAVYLGMADFHGWSDQAFVAQALKSNKLLLAGPLYRVLMFVASPAMLFRGAADRWAAMHKGILMSAKLDSQTMATVTITFPVRLMPEVIARCYGTAIQAALEAARVKSASVTLEQGSDERAAYRCTWA